MKFIDVKLTRRRNYHQVRRIDYRQGGVGLANRQIKPPGRFFFFLKIIILVGALAGFGWWLMRGNFFQVTEIMIEGNAEPETRQAIERLKGKNIFLLGGRRAEEELKRKQPGIKEIKIIRGLPNILKIQLVERETALTWESRDKFYLISREGVAFKESDRRRGILVKDENNLPVKLGGVILDKDFIHFVQAVNQDLPLQTEFEIDFFVVQESTYRLKVMTKSGKALFFNTMRQLSPQIEAVKKTWQGHQDEVHEYIDVSIEGKVYYK